MQLSRLGHGLAVSAVSALVITGLAVTSPAAFAADGAGVRMISQQDGVASVRRDADFPGGTYVVLAAEQLDAAASISFEYNLDASATNDATDWTLIGQGYTNAEGFVTYDWQPGPSLAGETIALRAVATVTDGEDGPETRTYSLRNDVALSGQDSPVHAVSLGESLRFTPTPAPGPFFAQPYASTGRTASLMSVSGATSASDGTVELSAWNAEAGAFQGSVAAAVAFQPLKAGVDGSGMPAPEVPGGRFSGVLDIAPFGVGDGDALAVRARRDSDVVYPTTLLEQAVTQVRAVGTDVTPERATVSLAVTDQADNPIVGAEVRRSSDGALVGYTDGSGRVVAEQAAGSTESYYANSTDVDAFEEEVDVVTDAVTIDPYAPTATTTAARFADGVVFDDREYAAGDIALQVLDEQGLPWAGEDEVTYSLHPAGTPAPAPEVATTDADGRFVVPFDPSGPDGDYVLEFSTPSSAKDSELTTVTFTAGDAELGLAPRAGTGPSGGTIAYTGTLRVAGKPLRGRSIDLGYARGTEQAPGGLADAGLGSQRALTGGVVTGADGAFAVTVTDAVETGAPAETGGRLTVTARGLGDAVTATADFAAGAQVAPSVDLPTVKVTLKGSSSGSKDRLRVSAPRSAGGATVKVRAKIGKKWRVVKRATLNRSGRATLTVRDRNGAKVTRYRVDVLATDDTARSVPKVIRLR